MAEAVQRYSALGYTWMKYHLSPFFNVFDQMDAIQVSTNCHIIANFCLNFPLQM